MAVPKVTVLLPTYNSSRYILRSAQSILDQTLKDFEFIIIDDGSQDDTLAKLQQLKDPRIRLISHKTNRGLIYSLNQGIEMAGGEYIARMDADDLSLPKRLERQVAYLDTHPDVGVLGGLMKWLHNRELIPKPVTHDGIRCWQLFHPCLCHPTVMMRTSVLQNHGFRYDEQYKHAEDYELWERLGQVTRLANLPYCVLYYRSHEGQVSRQHRSIQEQSLKKVQYRQLRMIGITPTEEEYTLHMQLGHFHVPVYHAESYETAVDWVGKVIRHNHDAKVYDAQTLHSVLNRCLIYSGRLPEGVYESD
ncbi:glycosyltransferase [Paenibacillus oralis]|uniref:Glycosyltransferase n=1 Tax=Paenibacillus oralis TaxID=2490856 RepID=A0A3P3U8V9_9BACL|nr:glycosyltransferase [Paenibacillus oralis]